jgi:homoserine dehydrogenase
MQAGGRLNLLLIGFGHVARAFVRLLIPRRADIEAASGLATRVVGIATARHGCALVPDGIDDARAIALAEGYLGVSSIHALAGDPPRDAFALLDGAARQAWQGPLVAIETTTLDPRRGEPATGHIVRALAAGAHVVTANKGPIACAWDVVRQAAGRADRHVLFESTVMDGIPVFGLVRDTLPGVRVTALRGIVNATTNYVLGEMEEGRELGASLAEMQARGIAEADPLFDLEGWDAAAKAAALANVLMGAAITPESVRRCGITHLTAADVRGALDSGWRLKLVMRVTGEAGRVSASVGPERVHATDVLAQVHGTMCALTISTDLLGDVTIVQHGGSVAETAYGVLADLITLSRRL